MTGPARGRLFDLDTDGPAGPYVAEDADFLAWYERWLDEAVAGYGVGWFGERLPLEEPGLLAVLAGDPSPGRRARAGESLLQLPALGEGAWAAVTDAMATGVDAIVRATLWDRLRWGRHKRQRRLDNADAIADDIARYARSCTPLGLEALSILRRLTVAAARRFCLARMHPRLRELQETENDPWVQHWLSWYLARQSPRDDPWGSAAPGYTEEPPF